ncbi:MAG TPA: helix-turn-helix transcriptional regulator [Steroidobacteraceae bacterium]|nr:helix-turn-helix transcriptional regulator [Steroidobacteraceae bacterium]
MNISSEKVRRLREGKSWSQEHLASASGVSVRTVQRVEAEGLGSAETRLALASALNVAASELLLRSPENTSHTVHRGLPRAALLGWAVGMTCALGAVAFNYSVGNIEAAEFGSNVGVIWGIAGATAGFMAALTGWIRSRA